MPLLRMMSEMREYLRSVDADGNRIALLEVARQGYNIQSNIFHIPDQLGLFSQRSPAFLVEEAKFFCFHLYVHIGWFVTGDLPLYCLSYNTTFFTEAVILALMHLFTAVVFWFALVVHRHQQENMLKKTDDVIRAAAKTTEGDTAAKTELPVYVRNTLGTSGVGIVIFDPAGSLDIKPRASKPGLLKKLAPVLKKTTTPLKKAFAATSKKAVAATKKTPAKAGAKKSASPKKSVSPKKSAAGNKKSVGNKKTASAKKAGAKKNLAKAGSKNAAGSKKASYQKAVGNKKSVDQTAKSKAPASASCSIGRRDGDGDGGSCTLGPLEKDQSLVEGKNDATVNSSVIQKPKKSEPLDDGQLASVGKDAWLEIQAQHKAAGGKEEDMPDTMHVYQNHPELILSNSQKSGPDLTTDKKNKSGREVLGTCEKKWAGEGRKHPEHKHEAACGEYTGIHIMSQKHDGKKPDGETQMVAVHRPNAQGEDKGKERPDAKKEDIEIQPPCDGEPRDGKPDGRRNIGGCATMKQVTEAHVVPHTTEDKTYDLKDAKVESHPLGPYEEDTEFTAQRAEKKANEQANQERKAQEEKEKLEAAKLRKKEANKVKKAQKKADEAKKAAEAAES
ncbi:unnamed protein product, partial [Clonostachys solani]